MNYKTNPVSFFSALEMKRTRDNHSSALDYHLPRHELTQLLELL